MSKKLLKEAQVRRFMGLAGMQANTVSNAVNEMYGAKYEEEEEVMETTTPTTTTTEAVTEEENLDELPAPEGEMGEEMPAEEPPAEGSEMEITQEEADVLAGVLEKLLAAQVGEPAEEPLEPAEEPLEPAEEPLDEPVEDDEAALEEVNLELSEDEIVQEVAKRVAKRIVNAKNAHRAMNEALGK